MPDPKELPDDPRKPDGIVSEDAENVNDESTQDESVKEDE